MLAAGAGQRLGYPKAALRLRGRWMLPRVVQALRAGGAQRVILVLSEAAERAIAGLGPHGADLAVLNPHPEQGRTGSLLCGLQAVPADAEALLTHPCDVPLLRAAAVAALVQAWRALPQPAGMLARPVTPSGRGGHPLLAGAGLLAELRALRPGQPLRDFVHAQPQRLLNVRLEGDPGPFLDVDTPEHAALLESLLTDPA